MQNEVSEDNSIQLTQAVMHTLDDWKFEGEQILSVMSLPKDIKVRHLSRFRQSAAFPNIPEVNERLRHILGIIDALATSYPTNPKMSLFWMMRQSKKFQNRTPTQVIIEDKLEGLITIRKHLDCSYDWFGDNN
ncbi:MAG: DUF2384 domain-containing protein [gamma proteobacterium symbiont of Taylorina sp.]|nr:DUF2384 domain-containing protein [gamma proteobacterium symbiont of Taylorina sp.]